MAKPLTGAILGVILGLAVAVILQQAGIWPLDQITVFFLPAILGFLGLLLLSMGREASTGTFITSLVILVPMAVWGALGIGDLNEQGQLNGGCQVVAQSSVPDTTNVIDTSKQDPFQIDPDGGLQWVASSPVVFDDYPWRIWVEVGGLPVTIESETNQDNDGGSQANTGDVANITEYAESKGIPLDQLRGTFKVGGDAANTCDGFAFVTLLADPFSTLASQIAAAVAVLVLILIIVLMVAGRGGSAAAAVSGGQGSAGGQRPGPAAEIAAGAIASGFATDKATDRPPDELSDDDVDEIGTVLDDIDDALDDNSET